MFLFSYVSCRLKIEIGKHLLNSGQSQYNIGLWRVSRIGLLFVVDRRCNLATEWTACDSDRTTPTPWRRSPATTTRFLNGIITINYERPQRRFVARCNEACRGAGHESIFTAARHRHTMHQPQQPLPPTSPERPVSLSYWRHSSAFIHNGRTTNCTGRETARTQQ